MQTAAEADAAAVCSGHYRTRIIYHIMQSFIQTNALQLKAPLCRPLMTCCVQRTCKYAGAIDGSSSLTDAIEHLMAGRNSDNAALISLYVRNLYSPK